jgi:hypothetical protein
VVAGWVLAVWSSDLEADVAARLKIHTTKEQPATSETKLEHPDRASSNRGFRSVIWLGAHLQSDSAARALQPAGSKICTRWLVACAAEVLQMFCEGCRQHRKEIAGTTSNGAQ